MAQMYGVEREERGGFNFDNVRRNEMLRGTGLAFKNAMKTGTTISGVVFKDGVVLGADTRSTNGETVADKNCEKIHYIAPNIYCCGAGTAADTEGRHGCVTAPRPAPRPFLGLMRVVSPRRVRARTNNRDCVRFAPPDAAPDGPLANPDHAGMIASNLELHRMGTKRDSRVITALTMLKSHLFKYQGHAGAALVLGVVRSQRPASVHACIHTVPPTRFPSRRWVPDPSPRWRCSRRTLREGMDEEEAKELVARSIRAGVFNDLGSGSNVDLCVITKEGVKYLRNHETPNERTYVRTKRIRFPAGHHPAQPTQLHDRHVRHPPAQRDCDHQRRCPGPDGDGDVLGERRLSNINRQLEYEPTHTRARADSASSASARVDAAPIPDVSSPVSTARRRRRGCSIPPGLQLGGVGVSGPRSGSSYTTSARPSPPTASDAAHANAAHMRQHCNVTSMRDPRGKRRRGGSSRSPSASSSSAPKPGSHLASRLTSA